MSVRAKNKKKKKGNFFRYLAYFVPSLAVTVLYNEIRAYKSDLDCVYTMSSHARIAWESNKQGILWIVGQ